MACLFTVFKICFMLSKTRRTETLNLNKQEEFSENTFLELFSKNVLKNSF